MQQRSGNTPPKAPAKTNAFKPKDPLTAPFKTTPREDKVVKEVRKRQDSKTAKIMAGRVGAQHGLTTPGSPFGAAAGRGVARDKYTQDLTAKATLAKAHDARLGQGGLLTPAQAKREKAAAEIVTTNPDQSTFKERHELGSLAAPAVSHVLSPRAPVRQAGLPMPPPPPPSDSREAAGAKLQARGLDKGGASGVLGDIVHAADLGLGTTIGVAGAGLGVGDSSLLTRKINDPHALITTGQAASRFANAGLHLPKGLKVAAHDVLHGGIHGTDVGAATTPGSYTPEQAAAIGFTPEYSALLMKQALKRGWYPGELRGLVGMDLLTHANADPPHGVFGTAGRIATNLGRGAAQTAGFATAIAGLGSEFAHGHGERALGQLGSDFKQQGAEWLEHPLQSAVADPFSLIPAVGAAGKTAGMVGLLHRGEMGLREIPTGIARPLAEGEYGPQHPSAVVSRGKYSRNLWTQTFERASDKRAAHGFAQAKNNAAHLDHLVRRAINGNTHQHVVRQVAYRNALRKLEGHLGGKKKRAEVLLGYLHAGGTPHKIHDYYASLGGEGADAGQAAFLRDHVIPETQHLSEADHAFLDAARNLSIHTSMTHVALKRFGVAAVLYRQLEPLIQAAAHAGKKLDHPGELTDEQAMAQHILDLREQVLNPEKPHAPLDSPRVPVRGGKISAAESASTKVQADVQKHTDFLNDHPMPKRPPKGAGPEANRAYRAEKATWDKKYAKPHAVATAKVAAATKAADVSNKHLVDLREADRAQHAGVGDQADIADRYEAALREFADKHVEAGGIMPARVEYTKAPLTSVKRYTRGSQGRGAARLKPGGPQKASTGATFRGGNYLIDANSPIRDSVHAMRLRTSLGAHNLLREHLAEQVPEGTDIPKGQIAVSLKSFNALADVHHHIEVNPVSESTYAGESSIRSRHASNLEQTRLSGDVTREPAYLIPKSSWDRMLDYTRPEPLSKYDRANRAYQHALISLFPGTVLGNTIGSVPLALASGAGQRAARDAAHAMRPGGEFRDTAPASLYGGGATGRLGHLATDAHNPASFYMNAMRGASIYGEDYSRVMAYFSKAHPIIAREAKRLGVSFDEYARHFASGKADPAALDAVLNHVEKFMGDTLKPSTEAGRIIGKGILFQQWVAHMAKLVLFTLPVKHPRRMLFLNTMAEYGDQYRQQHGAWPSWMTGFFPLIHEASLIPGVGKLPGGKGIQHWTHVFSLMNISPQSTAGGLMENLTQDRPLLERAAAVTGPAWQGPLTLISQDIANRGQRDASQKVDLGHAAVADVLGLIPGWKKANPSFGLRADSLPWDKRFKTYSDPLTGQLQSPFLNPGARPDQGIWGLTERLLGVNGYQVPNEGPINNKAISSAAYYARQAANPATAASQHRKVADRKALQGKADKARSGP